MIISEMAQHVRAFDGRRISKHNIIIIGCCYFERANIIILVAEF